MISLSPDKPFFVSSLEKIHQLLRREPVSPGFVFWGKRYAIQYNRYRGIPPEENQETISYRDHQILIIRPTVLMNGLWYEYFDNIDVITDVYFLTNDNTDDLFIDSWRINNDNLLQTRSYDPNRPCDFEGRKISEDELIKLVGSMISFLKILAPQEKNKRIVMNVCEETYTRYFEQEGFVPTGEKSTYESRIVTMEIALYLEDAYCIK